MEQRFSLTTRHPGPRVFDTAVIDWAGSFAAAALIAHYSGFPYRRALGAVVPAALATHVIVGHDTPFTQQVMDPDGHYGAKALVALSLLLVFVP